MRKYETVILSRQDISPSQVDALTTYFSQIITSGGGKIAHNEYCGLKTLAYRIKKNRKAHFVLLDIEAPAEAIKEMERLMRINEDVIRFLTVKVDEFGPRPSALMQSRYSRDDDRFNKDEPAETDAKESTDEALVAESVA